MKSLQNFLKKVNIEFQLLSQSENAYILQNLQNRQLAQATAVVQEGWKIPFPEVSENFEKSSKISNQSKVTRGRWRHLEVNRRRSTMFYQRFDSTELFSQLFSDSTTKATTTLGA